MNFLCISLFFRPFVFYYFFDELCRGHFCDHKQHKLNPFQPVKVKIIIHLWFLAENTICIDFVHKITFLSNFGVACMYEKLRSVVTVRPIFSKMVLHETRDLKVKSQWTVRSKNFAQRHNREICRGGHYAPRWY